jgi:hypothetical protein
MVEILKTELDPILDKFRTGKPFAFSRWGDGEWRSVLGKTTGQNCDGHQFYKALGVDLANVLRGRPEYMLGMQSFGLKMYPKQIPRWLQAEDLDDLTWYNADVFHYASIKDRLMDIVEALKGRHLVVVGPDHLKRLKPDYLDYESFVDVPPKNAYLAKDRIVRDIKAAVDGCDGKRVMVSLSAGMPAEIILDDLYKKLIGKGHSIVDFGSLWDPLVGVNSRRYHRALKKPK